MLSKVETKVETKKSEEKGIVVLNAALEERADGKLILRGSISPATLCNLKTDDYQREVLAPVGGKKSRLRQGVAQGVTLPDIELGMRGDNFEARGRTVTLHDKVYIIDGLQRVSALLAHLEDNEPTSTQPLGATIHLNTTKEWEKQRFADLNQLRTPVSPNVILRNARDKHPALLTLYGLSTSDKSFALFERVCWNQRMTKGELISAASLVRAALWVHRHAKDRVSLGSGPSKVDHGSGEKKLSGAPAMLDRIAKEIGLANYRENVRDFFELLDECFGVRSVEYGEAQAHLRGNFISVLGSFLSRNPQLWTDATQKRLHIDTKTKKRLAAFPVNDPEIRRLSSAGTMVLPTLYEHLKLHMNKGRKIYKFN